MRVWLQKGLVVTKVMYNRHVVVICDPLWINHPLATFCWNWG